MHLLAAAAISAMIVLLAPASWGLSDECLRQTVDMMNTHEHIRAISALDYAWLSAAKQVRLCDIAR